MGIIVPTNGKPIEPKQRAWKYAAIGAIVPLPFTALIGGAIGYYSGKNQQEEELTTGMKKVAEPTLLNGGLGKGLLWGGVVAAIAMAAVAIPAVMVGAAVGGAAATTIATSITTITGLVVHAKYTIDGAVSRRDEMQQEYQEAEQVQQSQSKAVSQGHSKSQSHGLSQQKSKAQNYQFDNSKMVEQRGDRKWVQDTAQKPSIAQGNSIA